MTSVFGLNSVRKTLSLLMLVVLVSFGLQFAIKTAALAQTFEVTSTN